MFVYGLLICCVCVFRKTIFAARIVLEAEDNELGRYFCSSVVLRWFFRLFGDEVKEKGSVPLTKELY
jgi:hypothetical protein